MMAVDSCPLCQGNDLLAWAEDRRRPYLGCQECGLVSVPPSYHLQAEQEKAEYDLHENSLADVGYRKFLMRASTPLISRLNNMELSSAQLRGLDFGCGPAPLLAKMLGESGFVCDRYDLFYFPDKTLLSENYDFIVTTEVVEHLSQPGKVLDELWQQIKPGGVFVIMTKRVIDQAAFKSWHYKNDPTHIVFFADASFEWLASRWQASLEFADQDVAIFTKSEKTKVI